MTESVLFSSFETGDIKLQNRIAMAPMTRSRAHNDANAPTDLHAEYYAQRASAGLIISEGSQISEQGTGYINTAGIHNDEQIAGWEKVLNKVHENDGVMYCQLWHTGRMSHNSFHDGAPPVSSSNKRADAKVFTKNGYEQASKPRKLSTKEVEAIVNDYRQAARNAINAGFDGVQIHGANGYIVEQFLHDSINDRTDKYGGSIESRAHFLFEILDAVADELGDEKVSLRMSPSNCGNTDNDSQSMELYEYVIRKINDDYDLAFLELMQALADTEDYPQVAHNVLEYYESFYDGVLMTNGNYDREFAMQVVDNGKADLVSFGRPFISNPDLPKRLLQNAPLNEANRETMYGGKAEGYIDYPFLAVKKEGAVV